MARLMRHPWHLIWIVIAYIPFLDRYSVPLTGDQKVYLSVALEMWERGEWLRPYLFGEPSYLKPPFQYWMTLMGWGVFGLGMWGALIPSVIATLLTAWFLGEISYELHGRKTLVHAGVLFAGMIGTMTFGTTAQMEIWVAFFYSVSWWAAMKFFAVPLEERKWSWIFLAFAVAGLSALVKSPLYSVFWVLSFFIYSVIAGEWELFNDRRLYKAWILGTVIGSLWFLAMFWIDRDRFWGQYFGQESFAKIDGNGGPWYTIWIALLYYCLPFSFLIIPSLRATRTSGWRAWRLFHFLLAWSLPAALFFTFYPYRIKPYAFILVPAIALGIDWGVVTLLRTKKFRRWLILTAIVLMVLSVAGVYVSLRFPFFEWSQAVGFAAAFLAVAFLAVLSIVRSSIQNLMAASLSLILVMRSAAIFVGEMEVRELKTWSQGEGRGVAVAMLDLDKNVWHEVGLISMVLERPIRRLMDGQSAKDWIASGKGMILTEEQITKFPEFRAMAAHSILWQRLRPRQRDMWKKLILGNGEVDPDLIVRKDVLIWGAATSAALYIPLNQK